jgi:thioredoxin reductase
MDEIYDVVVVGGSAAGLSGAVALARSRRSVLVVDAGDPRNAPAGHVHNFLTRDGAPPGEIYAAGRAEVTRYGGRVETGRVTALSRDGDRFRVQIGPRTVAARRLLVATGLRDKLPDVPGLAARWSIDVLHCPYCHGFQVRDQRIGILATGPTAVHQALLFRQLSAHVTLLGHSGPALTGEQREQLEARGITVTQGPVEEIEADASGLTGVRLADGRQIKLDAVIVAPRMHARAELLAPLGLEPAELRHGDYLIGTYIEADPVGATAVPGVWVAGNLANLQAQVITAAAAGLAAGAAINYDLVLDETRQAAETRHTTDSQHATVGTVS